MCGTWSVVIGRASNSSVRSGSGARARSAPDVEALALGGRVSRGRRRRARAHRRGHRPAHRLDVVLDQRRDLVRLHDKSQTLR